MPRLATPSRCRSGLTLVELCLVLALMVVIAAFAYPTIEGVMSRSALTGGGAIVRGGLAKARLAALESGKTQAFRVEPKGARFQVIALEKLSLPESADAPAENSGAPHEAEDIMRLAQMRLPDKVIFATADIAPSSQATAIFGPPAEGSWSAPILFAPDGTTSDASLVLQNDKGQTVRVTLRGLTGVATVSDVGREAVP